MQYTAGTRRDTTTSGPGDVAGLARTVLTLELKQEKGQLPCRDYGSTKAVSVLKLQYSLMLTWIV